MNDNTRNTSLNTVNIFYNIMNNLSTDISKKHGIKYRVFVVFFQYSWTVSSFYSASSATLSRALNSSRVI